MLYIRAVGVCEMASAAHSSFDAAMDDLSQSAHAALSEPPEDDEEDEWIALRTLFGGVDLDEEDSDGDVSERRSRQPNKPRDFNAGLKRIHDDYFAEEPVYSEADFERRFRTPRAVFNRIHDALCARPFFQRKTDALNKPGIHPLQKIVAAMRMMAYGVAGDAVDEYVRMSAPSALRCLKEFTAAVVEVFESEYLRSPTAEDMQRNARINAARAVGGVLASWAERIAKRGDELTDIYEHASLQYDLVEHLWQRSGGEGED